MLRAARTAKRGGSLCATTAQPVAQWGYAGWALLKNFLIFEAENQRSREAEKLGKSRSREAEKQRKQI